MLLVGLFGLAATKNAPLKPILSHADQIIVCPSPQLGAHSQQLQPCYPITTTPIPVTPPVYSPPDSTKTPKYDCTELPVLACDSCRTANFDPHVPLPKGCAYIPSDPSFTSRFNDPSCTFECVGKPVIYLYPQQNTLVDVTLTIPGVITISDPQYPTGGWKQVEAHPDGSLRYNGQTYRELYYETAIAQKGKQPPQGFFIPTTQLKEQLSALTARLGLLPKEQQEFLDYWLPKLTALHTPYIFFSVLDPIEKERIDHVSIAPKPDTMIAFLAYFKGVYVPFPAKTLSLPQTPPQRNGFTAVEWGGTIDHSN